MQRLMTNLPFWIAAVISALVAVLYAKLFAISEDFAFGYVHTNTIYVIAPLGIIASFLIGALFSKESLGSGIPQIIAAADLAKQGSPLLNSLLSLRMIFFKVIGSCLCALGGGSTGREGPTLHVSAGIFYQIARFWPKKWPKPSDALMVIAGGSAGLAAAFNTPLGGVVFAIEEISKSHISQVRTTVFQAVIIAGIISQMFLGNYLYLGSHPFMAGSVSVLFLQTLLIAFIVSLFGAGFAECIFQLMTWRSKLSFKSQLAVTITCAILFSAVIYVCGPSSIGGGKNFMADMLNTPQAPTNIWIPIGRLLGNFLTYVAGVIGGIFAPALAAGAAIAQWISQELGFQSLRIMALVGMVAFLTGVTRTPFTSFVLVLEMSDSHEVILYLMISSLVASVTSLLISKKGFYEKAAEQIIHSVP